MRIFSENDANIYSERTEKTFFIHFYKLFQNWVTAQSLFPYWHSFLFSGKVFLTQTESCSKLLEKKVKEYFPPAWKFLASPNFFLPNSMIQEVASSYALFSLRKDCYGKVLSWGYFWGEAFQKKFLWTFQQCGNIKTSATYFQ